MSSLYRNKPNAIPSFGQHIQTSIPAINVINLNITHCCSSPIPPWLQTVPTIWFASIRYDTNKKSNTPSNIYISKYNEIRSLYPRCIPIFTDGSKQSSHTADVTASTDSDFDEEDNGQIALQPMERLTKYRPSKETVIMRKCLVNTSFTRNDLMHINLYRTLTGSSLLALALARCFYQGSAAQRSVCVNGT